MRGSYIRSHEGDRLCRALDLLEPLGPAERAALTNLPLRCRTLAPGEYIERQGDARGDCCFVLEGLLCRSKILPHGQRQILSFYYPGDLAGIEMMRLRYNDYNILTLSSCRVAYVSHAAMEQLIGAYPVLAAAFWKQTLVEGAVHREWIIGIGRRTARERFAHLVCEMFVRMKMLGLAPANRFPAPLTQTDIADALGLSLVHVNRTLGELRRGGLIDFRRQTLQVINWGELRDLAGFDPHYLQIRCPFPEKFGSVSSTITSV